MCNMRAAWIMLCSTQNLHQAPLAICSPAPPPRHCYPGQWPCPGWLGWVPKGRPFLASVYGNFWRISKRGKGQLEHTLKGNMMISHWMEWWNDGMIKWWNDGMTEWWNGGSDFETTPFSSRDMGHGSVHAKVMKASNRIVPLYPISVRHPVMGWDTIIRPREGTTNKEEFFLLVERMTHGRYNLKINHNNICTHITWYSFI